MSASAALPANLWPLLWRRAGGSWPKLLQLATENSVLPLLFCDGVVPPEHHDGLRLARAMDSLYRRRTELARAVARHLLDLLGHDAFLFLKGSEYRHTLYAEPHLRPMNDLDFLVPPGDVDGVIAKLGAAGYTPKHAWHGATWVPEFHEVVFEIDHLHVELHRAFFQPFRGRIDYDAVWARRVAFDAGGVSAWRLADEDALVHTAINFSKDDFAVQLSRLVDLWLMLHQRTGALPAAVARAKEWRVSRAFYAALRMVSTLFPDVPPQTGQAMRELVPRRAATTIDALLANDGSRLPLDPLPRKAMLWRKYQLMDSTWRAIAFLAWHQLATLRGHALERQARRAARGSSSSTAPSAQ